MEGFPLAEQPMRGAHLFLRTQVARIIKMTSCSCCFECMDEFLEAPADEGRTLLMEAASLGHYECVRGLLAEGHQDVPGLFGNTALMYAALGGHVACVEALLADPRANPHHQDVMGETALSCAVAAGSAECVRLIQEKLIQKQ